MSVKSATGDADSPQFLTLPDGGRLAYHRRLPLDRTRDGAGILFLGGFRSDMTGTKAMFLDRFTAERGLAYVRFDYSGHGQSSGAFADCTIGRWLDDTLAIIDRIAEGKLILVGSSMGGWLMSLAARLRTDRTAGLVGIAAAPDFTERLMWPKLGEEGRASLLREGHWTTPSAYLEEPTIITRALIEEGRKHLLLSGPIDIRCPLRLLHGMADPDVPYQFSIDLAAQVKSEDARVILIKDGDHRLSRDSDLALLGRTIEELLA